MCLADRVLVYGDCAVNPQPDAAQLADIAINSAETAARFGVDVRIAMLSYSTGTCGRGEQVDAVRHATDLVRERRPELRMGGPIQYDAGSTRTWPSSNSRGARWLDCATVFIFPDLHTASALRDPRPP